MRIRSFATDGHSSGRCALCDKMQLEELQAGVLRSLKPNTGAHVCAPDDGNRAGRPTQSGCDKHLQGVNHHRLVGRKLGYYGCPHQQVGVTEGCGQQGFTALPVSVGGEQLVTRPRRSWYLLIRE